MTLLIRLGIPDGYYAILPLRRDGPYESFESAAYEAGSYRAHFAGRLSPAVVLYENGRLITRWEWLDATWEEIRFYKEED